jgi:dolichyl-phosphate-mannose--protein O-mannosyl transferase
VQEGRLILTDAQLMFWLVACLWTAQRWWARNNEDTDGEDACKARGVPATHANDSRVMAPIERNLWCIAVGLTCGCAFSVKMTGLATPGIIGIESFFGFWFLKRSVRFPELLKVAVVGLSLYAAFFAVHFYLCVRTGDGDEFMTDRFKSTLLGNRMYKPGATWEGFWWNLFYLNNRMVVHNASILEPHPWQTAWWEWMLNLRGLLYYSKDTLHTVRVGGGRE